MTQAATNRINAQHSTGPKTAAGKAVVATNATRHGILSTRLFLTNEQPDEFGALMDDLVASLRPAGALELVLVERIAAAIWRQRRLVAAETAAIELDRLRDNQREEVGRVLGIGPYTVERDDLETSPDDGDQLKWCEGVLAELAALDYAALDQRDFKRLKAEAPLVYGQAVSEATEAEETLEQYFAQAGSLREWVGELRGWCSKTATKLKRKPMVQMVAELVRVRESAPTRNELLSRYQTALDNELYKAIRTLREQQEWRVRSGITVEAEPEALAEAA